MCGAVADRQFECWNNKRWTQRAWLVLSWSVRRPYESGVAGRHVRLFLTLYKQALVPPSRSKARFWQLLADTAKTCSASLPCALTNGDIHVRNAGSKQASVVPTRSLTTPFVSAEIHNRKKLWNYHKWWVRKPIHQEGFVVCFNIWGSVTQ